MELREASFVRATKVITVFNKYLFIIYFYVELLISI